MSLGKTLDISGAIVVEVDIAPPTVEDLSAFQMQTDHGAWERLWPDPRERWAWLRWMNKALAADPWLAAPRRITTPPVMMGDKRVRLEGFGTVMMFVEHVARHRGVEI